LAPKRRKKMTIGVNFEAPFSFWRQNCFFSDFVAGSTRKNKQGLLPEDIFTSGVSLYIRFKNDAFVAVYFFQVWVL